MFADKSSGIIHPSIQSSLCIVYVCLLGRCNYRVVCSEYVVCCVCVCKKVSSDGGGSGGGEVEGKR